MYQFSLQFFLDIFQTILNKNPHLKGVADYGKRLSIITNDVFQVCVYINVLIVIISLMLQMVYTRVARGMLHNDRLVLAVLLARIHLKGVPE